MPAPVLTPIGYGWLAGEFQVNPMPHFVESFVADRGPRRTEITRGPKREIYPLRRHLAVTVFDHLEFALKNEGLHLELLRMVLPRLSVEDMTDFVRAAPLGIQVRRIGHLYEHFSGNRLPVPDLKKGQFIPLLDPELYFTGLPVKQARWRLHLNVLLDLDFSPVLRRTEKVKPERDEQLQARSAAKLQQVPAELFQRAISHLYVKETRTSYAIERETPNQMRADRFVRLLARAGREDFFTEPSLVALQNAIVDPRYAAGAWRTVQNYVSETLGPGEEKMHMVPPRPQDLQALMSAWSSFASLHGEPKMGLGHVPPIAAAAMISWLFVYLHPFEDGNGRIHRFLIHHVLALRQFGPQGIVLPVSAVLLNRSRDYDASLESFSRPLMERTEYELSSNGDMRVLSESLDRFRYIDCTEMAEALYDFLEDTIDNELPRELKQLQRYDDAREAMRDIVDMPEKDANLFLNLCLQNHGRLSKSKRGLPAFERLSDAEITVMEDSLIAIYELSASSQIPP